jgi:hypothetical protein
MRREARHSGLARIGQVVREAGQFVAVDPGVDEQHASPAPHDNGVALAELALMDQHTLRDLPQQARLACVADGVAMHRDALLERSLRCRRSCSCDGGAP